MILWCSTKNYLLVYFLEFLKEKLIFSQYLSLVFEARYFMHIPTYVDCEITCTSNIHDRITEMCLCVLVSVWYECTLYISLRCMYVQYNHIILHDLHICKKLFFQQRFGYLQKFTFCSQYTPPCFIPCCCVYMFK